FAGPSTARSPSRWESLCCCGRTGGGKARERATSTHVSLRYIAKRSADEDHSLNQTMLRGAVGQCVGRASSPGCVNGVTSLGPPNGPAAFQVSATRHGVTG